MTNNNYSQIRQEHVLLLQARHALDRNNKKEAFSLLQKILKLNNSNTKALLLYAKISPSKESSAKALDRLLSLEPNNDEAKLLHEKIIDDYSRFQPKEPVDYDIEFERLKLEQERLNFEKEKLRFEQAKQRTTIYSQQYQQPVKLKQSNYEPYSFDDNIPNSEPFAKTSTAKRRDTEIVLGFYRAFLFTPGFLFVTILCVSISFFTYGVPLILLFLGLIRWYKSHLTVTNKRITLYRGNILFGGNERSARLEQITDITVRVGMWGAIFGYGELYIETSGSNSTEFPIRNVTNPKEVKRLIERATH